MAHLLLHEEFFAMVQERYRIKQRRDEGQPFPWSTNKVFQEWRFTNVFREDDRTTTWFRENIRDVVNVKADKFNTAAATLIFRWFNRISTGEIIKDMLDGENRWSSREAQHRLKGVQPIVTGAYMIKTFNGMNKLDGILLAIDGALPILATKTHTWGPTLEGAWNDLVTIPFIGGFMAHEIVQDLRYTHVLENASDIMTWTHLGPGAIRGMSWMLYGNDWQLVGSKSSQQAVLGSMRELLELSKEDKYWPKEWPAWEMHQVEFALCEFSKYKKASKGIAQKRRYSQGGEL